MLSRILLLLALTVIARSDFTPTAPGPGDSFAAGSACQIQWTSDDSGQWKNVSICESSR